MNNWLLWTLWLLLTAGLSLYLALPLFSGSGESAIATVDKSMYLIGTTSAGHHQIELACENCHTDAFGGAELLQDACENCHLAELNAVRDAHPKRKFTDPGNADRVAALDARFCVTCHREHKPDITGAMGLTVPGDVCFLCHEGIGEDRTTHQDLGFDTCASAGCHNFHDNRALFEDFLVENAGQPPHGAHALVAPLTALEAALIRENAGRAMLEGADADAPADWHSEGVLAQWARSAHAMTGVNCSGCHQDAAGRWSQEVSLDDCRDCHENQAQTFLLGKHGMRLAAGLSPMTPGMARIPMHDSAAGRELSCISCHGEHDFSRQLASIDACTGCHASGHVQAYESSPHARLARAAFNGAAPEESAVTYATCHLPRETELRAGQTFTHVQHNQNANLRPNDKMLRSVCMNCHSLEFSIDALADPALVANNFSGLPAVHVESIDMAVTRRQAITGRDDTYR